MTIWVSLLLCLGNVATSLAGMAALKHAVATSSVSWALVAVGCWVGTALFIALLLAHQPIIWIALMSSCLSVLGSVAIGYFAYGEPLVAAHVAGLILILAALALTSSTS